MNTKIKFLILIMLILLVSVFSLIMALDLKDFMTSKEIVLIFKLPKMITAIFCGGILSLCGLLLQNLLKNPLAEPHILGIQSGSSFFIIVYILLLSFKIDFNFISDSFSYWPFLFSFVGSLISTFLLVLAFRFVGNVNNVLIVGIMLSVFFSSMTSFVSQWLESQGIQAFINWSYGSFENTYGNQLYVLSFMALSFLLLVFYFRKDFDLYSLGELTAKSLGLNTKRLELIIIFSSSIMCGLVCALSGPIGFVGFIAPHIAKKYFKISNFSVLSPGSFLMGSLIALCMQFLCDIMAPIPMNLSTVSGILSIPFIMAYILRDSRKYYET